MKYLLIAITLVVGYMTYEHSFDVMIGAIEAKHAYIEQHTR